MSTQSPYLNAIILFPLITQVIGSSIAYVIRFFFDILVIHRTHNHYCLFY